MAGLSRLGPGRIGTAPVSPTHVPVSRLQGESGSGWLVTGFLLLVAIEYGGLYVELPLLKSLHVATLLRWGLLALLLSRVRLSAALATRQIQLLLAIWALTVLAVFYAEVQLRAYVLVEPLFLSTAFTFVTIYLMDRPSRVDKLALLLAPIAAWLVWKNLGRMSATRLGGLSAPFFMGDRNDFAWAMLVLMPLIAILLFGRRNALTRMIGVAGVSACVVGVLYSQSRGAAFGLAAALLYGWLLVSKRRAVGMVAVAIVCLGVYYIAPDGYFTRIESVSSYEEDNSAQGRLEAWSKAIEMATDHPLGVGAGNFPSAYGRHYRNLDTTRMTYGAARWVAPHSIYFRVLGEYGFGGLGILLWLLIACLRDNLRAGRLLRQQDAPAIDPRWPALINMSLVGFAVAGIFLGGFDFPHLFLLAGLTLATRRMSATSARATSSAELAAGDAASTAGSHGAQPTHWALKGLPVAHSGSRSLL